jgi:hypothetical protein
LEKNGLLSPLKSLLERAYQRHTPGSREYEKMKEDLHDLAIVAQRSYGKTISYEEMKRNCKNAFNAL